MAIYSLANDLCIPTRNVRLQAEGCKGKTKPKKDCIRDEYISSGRIVKKKRKH